ncbi:XrtA system polysaccharide deacetylase [Sphingomonas sp. Leaf4]|uniref:XrtA system polysaccharide deacetylase n=1 Tax=Sphingomonas sp. Leaf4 TaxID=2876553 RepID=UPI001E4B2F87|nr:XrtA system polysaccharide deacetylase [Sphingomonas sp. Leaf4]
MRNAMSVDVEDWFQVGAFETVIDRRDWNGLEHRVEANTDAVLDLFAEADVQATFFTLGWVADRFPALMRRIVAGGHEVASHGYDHARVFTFTPDQFRADLAKARTALEDASGQAVAGYRAPSFSIDTRTPWAHGILAEAGYAYSSSVAPVRHDHYGWQGSPRAIHRPLADAELIEWPITLARVAGRDVPAGGGFFRLLPNRIVERAVERSNGDDRHPAMFYFHPWEIDPGQPRVARAPLRSRIRHYSRLGAMAGKLRRLLAEHQWDRSDRIVAAHAAGL